jgi:hypothetical protein
MPFAAHTKGGDRIVPPVDRWTAGVPTDERSKTPLKIGIGIDMVYPVDRWNELGAQNRTLCPLLRWSSGWTAEEMS